MALALNNLKRVDMPLNKETKPNQTITGGINPSDYSTFHIPEKRYKERISNQEEK